MSKKNNVTLSMRCQEAEFWCWAAVAQSIDQLRGSLTTQSDVAAAHITAGVPGHRCSPSDTATSDVRCGAPCSGECNSPHKLSLVLADCGHSVNARRINGISFRDVVDVIDAGKPLPLRINITTGALGGHFICIVGYSDDGLGNQFVEVLDPLVPGIGSGDADTFDVPFDDFKVGRYAVNGELGEPNYIYELL